MSGSVDARTRPCFEAAYPAGVPRALAGERFAFPTNLAAPALTAPSQPLTAAERTETQRWALSLSRIADPETRQAALAPAPADSTGHPAQPRLAAGHERTTGYPAEIRIRYRGQITGAEWQDETGVLGFPGNDQVLEAVWALPEHAPWSCYVGG